MPASSPARRAKVWLFDLDNTLHDASPHIFPHINAAMTAYMQQHLGLDEDEANRLRQHYWDRYGATLLGLIRHHGTDPHHFLWHTHQFPDLAPMVIAEKQLKSALARLPGRKVLFSNAPRHYTEAILDLTGIGPYFDAIYTVERLRFQPKPQVAGFIHLLRSEKLDPRRCIMVEDTLANLRTAKRLGMTTVWVSASSRQPPYVDATVRSACALPRLLRGVAGRI